VPLSNLVHFILADILEFVKVNFFTSSRLNLHSETPSYGVKCRETFSHPRCHYGRHYQDVGSGLQFCSGFGKPANLVGSGRQILNLYASSSGLKNHLHVAKTGAGGAGLPGPQWLMREAGRPPRRDHKHGEHAAGRGWRCCGQVGVKRDCVIWRADRRARLARSRRVLV